MLADRHSSRNCAQVSFMCISMRQHPGFLLDMRVTRGHGASTYVNVHMQAYDAAHFDVSKGISQVGSPSEGDD